MDELLCEFEIQICEYTYANMNKRIYVLIVFFTSVSEDMTGLHVIKTAAKYI